MLKELGKVVIDVGVGEEVELDLDELIPISEDLNMEFSDQAALYAYIAMLAAQAEAVWLDSKRDLDEVYAVTDKAVRQDFVANNERVTEGKVAAEIKIRKGYSNAVDEELFCHEQFLIMRALERAMSQRAQMLISLGAHLRAEAEQTGMLIRDTKKEIDRLRKHKRNGSVERDIPF